MPELVIKNLNNKRVELDQQKSILQNIQDAGLDWMHLCGGKGRCITCRVEILDEDSRGLSPLTSAELHFQEQGYLKEGFRLTCQTYSTSEVNVYVPKSCQLPHLDYDSLENV